MSDKPAFSFDALANYKGGSTGKYFSLKNGEEARVRFVYGSLEEMKLYMVHEFTNPYATIACAREEGQGVDACKWCSQGNKALARVVFPIFNLETNEIQYWKRTAQFAQEKVIPMLQEIASQNKPLVSQVYKIKRTGDGRDTTYTVVPTGVPDTTTMTDFEGKVDDPYDVGVIKETNYEYNPGANANNANTNNSAYGNTPTATRRTTAFE